MAVLWKCVGIACAWFVLLHSAGCFFLWLLFVLSANPDRYDLRVNVAFVGVVYVSREHSCNKLQSV